MTLYLAPSIWRSVDPRTMSAVLASITSNPTAEHVIFEPLWNDALIGRSRSLLATKFLETEADVMVIFDDDIVWNPDDFWKLVEGARDTRSIYCGPFVTRSDKPHLASRMFAGSSVNIIHTPQRRPVEIEYAATGFVAIHRDVFEAMLAGEFRDADGTHRIHECTKGGGVPFYPFFSPFTLKDSEGAHHYLSEDWAFCERARQLGFKVWMDESIILQHMGWYPFSVADLNQYSSPFPSTGTDLVEVAGAPRHYDEPLLRTLIQDIARWAGESEGDVRRMLPEGQAKAAELWNARTELEHQWYRREDVGLAYVSDLAHWHLNGGCPLELAYGLTGRVLDFGAGIGTFALAAAREANVTAVEPNATLVSLMAHRANRHGIELVGYADLDAVPPGRFNTIVAWHVFEHLTHPEAVLRQLAARLEPGGILITQSDFDRHDSHPMHHVRDDWADVLIREGFVAIGPDQYRLEPARELVAA